MKLVDSFLLSLPGSALKHGEITIKKPLHLTVEQFVITRGWPFRGFAPLYVCSKPGSHWLWVQLWVLTTTANANQGPQAGVTWEKGSKHLCCTRRSWNVSSTSSLSAALASFLHVLLQHCQKQRVIQIKTSWSCPWEEGRREGDTGGSR